LLDAEVNTGRSEPSHGLQLRGVSRTFIRNDGTSVDAVTEVDLTVRRGEFVCIVGPSGHGKTTLLQMIAGLLPPTGGTILFEGREVAGPGADRGVVFQKDSVFPWRRVIANVEFGLKCRGVAKETRREIATRYLDLVGLKGLDRAWPRELSGGMLKRVAVATVFATGSQVLLLDEPFAMVDYVTKRQLHRVLLKLWAEADDSHDGRHGQRIVIFVTHDVDEALTLGDRVVVVKRGRLVEDLRITLPRPRTDDDLAQPEALEWKHILLKHLGLEEAREEDEQHESSAAQAWEGG
jgi:NitT/TauT family transport system ATP-binding protein